jgi:hypothetical protein
MAQECNPSPGILGCLAIHYLQNGSFQSNHFLKKRLAAELNTFGSFSVKVLFSLHNKY